MCNCRAEIQAKLQSKIASQLPEGAKNLHVELGGYVFLLGAGVSMRNALPIEIEYEVPVKKHPGEFKTKRQKMNMNGSYCMFCGEKYVKDAEEGEPAAPADQTAN